MSGFQTCGAKVKAHLTVVGAAPAAGSACHTVVLISVASRVGVLTWGKAESKDQYKLGEGRCTLSAELSILVIKCNMSFIISISFSPPMFLDVWVMDMFSL
jgi:hypothetical protein